MRDVFAHGMLSMCFMARLVNPTRVKSFGVRFVAITWVGAEITVGGYVSAVDRQMKQLTLELRCVNQKG